MLRLAMLRALRLLFGSLYATLAARRARGPLRPSWSFAFEWVLRTLRRDWEDSATWPLTKLRAAIEARPYPSAVAWRARRRDASLGGVPTRWFSPKGSAEKSAILFFHGGSFIYGSARSTHEDVIARIALASRVPVAAPDYRLVPEHRFPAQLEDAIHAFDALVASGVDASRVVVAGDSAGGNLAIELQIALRDRGGPQAAAAVLVSPWCDLEMPGESYVTHDRFDFGTRVELSVQALAYAGDVPLDDPRISPSRAELRGLAPVLVVVGEVEILHDDIRAFARALEGAAVDVTVHVAKDMPHNAPVFAAMHPSGQIAVEAIGRFVRKTLALEPASA